MEVITIVMLVMVMISGLFILLGAIGLHRFPDVYTRLHAATKATTFGSIFLALAVISFGIYMYVKDSTTTEEQPAFIVLVAHTLIALIMLLLTNPTGAHAIARAARRSGIEPERAVIDETEVK
jgi:multicomponent Na+:H+ antiporter subunit G